MFDSSIEFNLPQVFTGGLAFWPIRDGAREWKLEVDLDYADWSTFDDLDVKLSNGVTVPFPRDWTGAFVVMLGTEYKWVRLTRLPEWEVVVRGGYVYAETPLPESTFEPAVPDSDCHALSVGLGFLCKEGGSFFGLFTCGDGGKGWLGAKAIGMDVAYQAILYDSRTIQINVDPRVNGTWDTTLHVGALNLR